MGRKRKLTQSEMENLRTTGWRDGVSKREIKAYTFTKYLEADLLRLKVVGIAQPAPARRPSPHLLGRRLDLLEACLKGARAVPPELQGHVDDLLVAVQKCRGLLAADDLEGARQLHDDIEGLACTINEAARIHKFHTDRSNAGKARAEQQRKETLEKLEAVESIRAANPRLSWEAAARVYLRGHDDDWHVGTDGERRTKVDNLTRRLRDARRRRRNSGQ